MIFDYESDAKAVVIENIITNTYKDPLQIVISDPNISFNCETTDETVQ